MYTMVEPKKGAPAEIFYRTPCGDTVHMATVLDRGTGDERVMLDPAMNGKPILPNVMRNILSLLDAEG